MQNLYPIFKKLIFLLEPETAHNLTFKIFQSLLNSPKLVDFMFKNYKVNNPKEILGLKFNNPVGLAAGLDKDGSCLEIWEYFGFGFIECGTVTPKAQIGNPKPRLFRIKKEETLLNKMGFNNLGILALEKNLKKTKYKGVIGVNIGKNKDTNLENSIDDYLICFNTISYLASYITINISSPNTENLRKLQFGEYLDNLLNALKKAQKKQKKYTPLFLKIAPDLTALEVEEIAKKINFHKIDGVIATNTTVDKSLLKTNEYKNIQGGLSGRVLTAKSLNIVKQIKPYLDQNVVVIGIGGISSLEDAINIKKSGADLLQIYTGFIYQGISLINKIAKNID